MTREREVEVAIVLVGKWDAMVMVDGVEAFGVTRARDDALCVRCEQFDGEWELRGRRVPAMCSLCVCALVVDGLMAAEVKGS